MNKFPGEVRGNPTANGDWSDLVRTRARLLSEWSLFVEVREIGLLLSLFLAALVVQGQGAYWTRLALLVVIFSMAAQGLDLITGYAGQFSLGHSGLFAIGGYSSAIVFFSLEWPFPSAVLFAVGISAAGGVILGGPALRVGGLYLALVTLSFAFIMRNLVSDAAGLTQGTVGIGPLDPGGFISSHYLIVCSVVLGIVWALLRRIVSSHWGRVLVAIRESESLAKSIGVRVWQTKLSAFAISAAATGLAGALYAHQGYISPHNFGWELSLMFLVILFLGGIGTLLGAFLGAVVIVVVPEVLGTQGESRLITYGVILVVIMLLAPSGLVGGFRRVGKLIAPFLRLRRDYSEGGKEQDLADDIDGRGIGEISSSLVDAAVVTFEREGSDGDSKDARDGLQVLSARGMSKRFSGVTALTGVDLKVRAGELVGLIGPNGSGKTTLLNCMCGQLRPDGGSITLGDRDLTRSDPSERARSGVYRTFQEGAICPSLTIRDNVMLGGHRWTTFGLVRSMITVKRRYGEDVSVAKRANLLLSSLGVHDRYMSDLPDEVPYGIRRLSEIAIALMAKPKFLLLDEPAAGLVEYEIERLEHLLRMLVTSGIGIVLVEHHLSLVMRLADRVTVLDSGRAISEGSPTEIANDAVVQRAYLGREWQTDAL